MHNIFVLGDISYASKQKGKYVVDLYLVYSLRPYHPIKHFFIMSVVILLAYLIMSVVEIWFG